MRALSGMAASCSSSLARAPAINVAEAMLARGKHGAKRWTPCVKAGQQIDLLAHQGEESSSAAA